MSIETYLFLVCVVGTAANVLSALMFLSRVHWPARAQIWGNMALAMGVPALALGIVGIARGFGALTWLMPTLYAAFCLVDLYLDVIAKIEFRQPRRLAILVPFLILFYVPLIGMWSMLWNLSILPWAVAGVAYFAMLGSSFYALGKGVG